MTTTPELIARMKTVLREQEMPMFSDVELESILNNSDSFDMAVYKAAIMKSENTQLVVSGVTIADTSAYFLRIARMHRPSNSGQLKGV